MPLSAQHSTGPRMSLETLPMCRVDLVVSRLGRLFRRVVPFIRHFIISVVAGWAEARHSRVASEPSNTGPEGEVIVAESTVAPSVGDRKKGFAVEVCRLE